MSMLDYLLKEYRGMAGPPARPFDQDMASRNAPHKPLDMDAFSSMGGRGVNTPVGRMPMAGPIPQGSTTKLPLHLDLMSKGIPITAWPESAKNALGPEQRRALEDQLARDSDLYANNPMPTRPIDRVAQASEQAPPDLSNMLPAAAQAATPTEQSVNPYMQAMLGGTAAAQANTEAGLAAQVPTYGQTHLLGKPDTGQPSWQDAYTVLQQQVDAGTMGKDEARALMDGILRKSRNDRSVNPFNS